MAHTSYPTGDDLRSYLESAGVELPPLTLEGLDDAAEAGWQAFNRRVNRVMLASASATRPVGPGTVTREGLLVLPWDVAVLTGLAWQPTGADAVTWTEGTHYALYPTDTVAQGKPIRMIQVSSYGPWWGCGSLADAGALKVTGRFGYAVTLPARAWRGMLALGALELLPQIQQATGGNVVEYAAGTVREKFAATGSLGGWMTQAQTLADAAIAEYRWIGQ